MTDLPFLDLSVLHLQLSALFRKGCLAAERHDTYLSNRNVPRSWTASWYQENFNIDDEQLLRVYDDSICWIGYDSDGDSQEMCVPISVLEDRETPEEWGERTYTRYLQSEDARKSRMDAEWKANKDFRREQYERLKAEFEDTDETNGHEAG